MHLSRTRWWCDQAHHVQMRRAGRFSPQPQWPRHLNYRKTPDPNRKARQAGPQHVPAPESGKGSRYAIICRPDPVTPSPKGDRHGQACSRQCRWHNRDSAHQSRLSTNSPHRTQTRSRPDHRSSSPHLMQRNQSACLLVSQSSQSPHLSVHRPPSRLSGLTFQMGQKTKPPTCRVTAPVAFCTSNLEWRNAWSF